MPERSRRDCSAAGRVQGIVIVRSGQPFTPTVSRDVANTGIGNQRPKMIGKPVIVGAPTCWYYSSTNAACAALDPSAQMRSRFRPRIPTEMAELTCLRSQWLRNLDVSVFKQFPITESSVLQFRAEFFNVTNTPTFGIPNTIDTILPPEASSPRRSTIQDKCNLR